MNRHSMLRTALAALALTAAALVATSTTDPSPAAAAACSSKSTLDLPSGQSASRRPVIFVHGWTSNRSALTKAGAVLYSQTGYQISTYYFDYADDATSWAGSPAVSGCLATYIQAVSHKYHNAGGDGKVILIGHSMGGLAALYASVTTSSLIGGLITFDTPYLGSPFGNTGIASWWQGLQQSFGKSIAPPQGSDAQICLATHDGGSALPSACKYPLAPYLPAGTRIDSVAGDISIRRMLLGVHLYDFDLGSDGVVPSTSGHGYLTGELGGRAPAHTSERLPTDTCTVTNDAVLGLIRNSLVPIQARIAEDAIFGVFTDNNAMDGLLAGKLTPGLVAYLGAATVLAPCSHIHVYNDQSALNEATQALKDDLAALTTAGQASPVTKTDLLSAPIPPLRGNPAGHLTNGEFSGPDGGNAGLTLTGGGAPALGDLTGDGIGDAAAVIYASSGAGGSDQYVELYANRNHLLGGFDPVSVDPHGYHANVMAMLIKDGDVLLDWYIGEGGAGSCPCQYWSGRLHWTGTNVVLTGQIPHTGITNSGLWSDPALTISSHGLGAVRIGMTAAQTQQAAGVPFDGTGDGANYPNELPAGYPHNYVHGSPVTCIGSQVSNRSPAQTIATPEGFHLGDSVTALTALYGTALRFIPEPTGGGLSPHAGYILSEGGGTLVFQIDASKQTVTGILVGGPDLTPSSCNG